MKRNIFIMAVAMSTLLACKKDKGNDTPDPNNTDKLTTHESLVNDNANWKTLVTTSAYSPESFPIGFKLELISAAQYNKHFKILIQQRTMNDQFSWHYYLKFDRDANGNSLESFKFETMENEDKTTPNYYKDPNNENEYYIIGRGGISKSTVSPQSGSSIKYLQSYRVSWSNTPLVVYDDIDFTSDFALCGTSPFDACGLYYSPPGINNTTYFHMPPQSDFNDHAPAAGSAYHAATGFFNNENQPRFLGIHFNYGDNGNTADHYSIKAKCYYLLNTENKEYRASHYSGQFPVRSMALESEMVILPSFRDVQISRRMKHKTLKTDRVVYFLANFYEAKNHISLIKYDYVNKKFTTILPLQEGPKDFKIEKAVISPDQSIYFYDEEGVYIIKNGQTKTIHDKTMFKDPNNALTKYLGIAMKGDRLLVFVDQSNWVNNLNIFDFKVSTILAKTAF